MYLFCVSKREEYVKFILLFLYNYYTDYKYMSTWILKKENKPNIDFISNEPHSPEHYTMKIHVHANILPYSI